MRKRRSNKQRLTEHEKSTHLGNHLNKWEDKTPSKQYHHQVLSETNRFCLWVILSHTTGKSQ